MPTGEDRFYDILFEISNDIRHNILLLLHENPERMTNISKQLDLTSPEVSRHLSRLSEHKLIEKDSDNYYHVTKFGEYLLNQLFDLEFITKHRDYFVQHSAVKIPIKYQKRMSELANYKPENNFLKFLDFINEKIKQSEKHVNLYIDQFPVTCTESIKDSVKRGITYKIIHKTNITIEEYFEHKTMIPTIQDHPQVEIKTINREDAYIFISDQGSAIAFPTINGFDYTGFINHNPEDNQWIKDLFNHYWTPAEPSLLECTLCSTPIRGNPIIETINGSELVFDTMECVRTYKKLKQIYGAKFQ